MYYFDNAATTAQKPEAVAHARLQCPVIGNRGQPVPRGPCYALKAYGIVLQAKDDVKPCSTAARNTMSPLRITRRQP